MRIYNSQEEVEKDVVNWVLKVDDDVTFNFDLIMDIDIIAHNINVYNFYVHNIDAHNINSYNIMAIDINANNIDAIDISVTGNVNVNNITAISIYANNINANYLKVYDVNARNNINAKNIHADTVKANNVNYIKKIKILDAFAWIGGFSLALEQSIGKENVEHIGFSEIDKFAKAVYKKHFPAAPDLWDITKINIEKLPNFNLLTGGFPCQDISVAWKQNLAGGRTVLVEYLLQILEKKQPDYFIFENVKNLLSKRFTEFFESIIDRIKKAGYDVKFKVLNTKDFWLPQNRQRVFIVWSLQGLKKFEFPQGEELKIFLKDILEEKVDSEFYLTENHFLKDLINDKNVRIKEFSKFNQDNIFCWKNDIVPSLTAWDGYNRPKTFTRRLTPIECERLQWFPDNWTSVATKRQRYKQIWNAISVPVVKAIFNNLINK